MNTAQANLSSSATSTRNPSRIAARSRSILGDLLPEENIILDFDAASKTGVFEFVANFLAEHHGLDAENVFESLAEREELGSTGLGRGVAIPHARVAGLERATAVFVRVRIPIAFDAPDGKPVSQMLVLLVPEHANDAHLKVLADVAAMFCDSSFRDALCSATDPAGVRQLFATWRSL